MQITMLGTGHARVLDYYNTCFMLRDGEFQLLVDCGGGSQILKKLDSHSFAIESLRNMFLTHAHTDHVLGAIWVIRFVSRSINKGQYTGDFNIYCHPQLADTVISICNMTIQPGELKNIGKRILFHRVEDGEAREISGLPVTFFDIRSDKAKQFGFSLKTGNGQTLTCLGDEPYMRKDGAYIADCDLLMHESFCLYADRDIYKPYDVSHCTVREGCQLAQRYGIPNLLLYHTEEETIGRRKELYTQEGSSWYSGNLIVPDEDETIVF